LNKSQLDGLTEELAALLEREPLVLMACTFLLTRSEETTKEELAVGMGSSDEEVRDLLSRLDADGLTIRGEAGFYPVHPSLGIGNASRLSTAEGPAVKARRQKVDSPMPILAS
jgi:hypothetical protein